MKIKKFKDIESDFSDQIEIIYNNLKDFLSDFDLIKNNLSCNIYQNWTFHFDNSGRECQTISYTDRSGDLKMYYSPGELRDNPYLNYDFCGIKLNDGIESISKIQSLISKVEICIITPRFKGDNNRDGYRNIQNEIEKWVGWFLSFYGNRKA